MIELISKHASCVARASCFIAAQCCSPRPEARQHAHAQVDASHHTHQLLSRLSPAQRDARASRPARQSRLHQPGSAQWFGFISQSHHGAPFIKSLLRLFVVQVRHTWESRQTCGRWELCCTRCCSVSFRSTTTTPRNCSRRSRRRSSRFQREWQSSTGISSVC